MAAFFRSKIAGPALAFVAAGAAVAACSGSPAPVENADSARVRSNVMRADYAGSASCAPCHGEIHDAWARSPMRNMTRHVADTTGEAFDGRSFAFKGDVATLETHDGRRYMRLRPGDEEPEHLFLVTKVIGGRYREDYVGREVAGTAADSPPLGDAHDERIMPVSYLKFNGKLRYKGYSVMLAEREELAPGVVWRQRCIFCHNTTPLLTTLYDDIYGDKATTYQGVASDYLLPRDRKWNYRVTDRAAFAKAVDAELALIGAPPASPAGDDMLDRAIKDTRARFGEEHLVELGIGCETCHGGSAEHVRDARKKPSFLPVSTFVEQTFPDSQGAPSESAAINHVCQRCHTVLFKRYPYAWEGAARMDATGGSSVNSGEARDFLLGGCANAMRCTACHDPHGEDDKAALDALGTVSGNHVCTSCHQGFAAREALAAHTHHAADGEGSACLSCHMPRKNAGLGYRLSRYHRIGSPTDRARVEKDRPLECAICHADKSVASLLGTMETWWKKRYDRAAVQGLYGDDLTTSPLAATLERGKPHEQITAAAVLGSHPGSDPRALVPLLTHEIPFVRYFTRNAIETLVGREMPVDLDDDAESIEEDARAWLDAPR